MNFIEDLSHKLGAPVAGVVLIISFLLGYPVAIIYRSYIHSTCSKTVCQLFLTVTGLLLCIFNFGFQTIHMVIAVLTSYLFIQFLPPRTLLVPATFTFNFLYLLYGYYTTGTDDYDITWTIPHCVLTLRLIGLAFDISDGTLPEEKQSKDMKRFKITDKPSLLEVATYSYFPTSVMIGPQYSLNRLRSFLNHEFDQYDGNVQYGMKRFLYGLLYLTLSQTMLKYVPDSYLVTPEFISLPFLYKIFYLVIWVRGTIYKYMSCWLITEGSSAWIGLSFASKSSTGEVDWTGCSNVKISVYEFSLKFGHIIEAFNTKTNEWVAHYIFKRLKFLGNRNISYIVTLFFLALWHGFYSGYYMAFGMEFIELLFEKNVETVMNRSEKAKNMFKNPAINFFITCLMCVYINVFAAWNLIPFVLLRFDKWWPLYKCLYFIGFVFYIPAVFLTKPILQSLFPPTKKSETNGKQE